MFWWLTGDVGWKIQSAKTSIKQKNRKFLLAFLPLIYIIAVESRDALSLGIL